jgi:hypothetical protein
MRRWFLSTTAAALLLPLFLLSEASGAGAANDHTVLILESSVAGGISSPFAQRAIALGYDVELVDNTVWLAKSTADFATYRAIILGDPHSESGRGTTSPIAAAEASVAVWGPAIDGNMLIVGNDPAYHIQWISTAIETIDRGIEYVLANPVNEGKTGFYFATSWYYNQSGQNNTVEVLRYFGSFVVSENTTCHDDIHVTAPAHLAMAGISDQDLSNWNCSIHALFTRWPANFTPLAMAEGLGALYTAPDGTTGTPYIFARTAACDAPSITLNNIAPDTIWTPNKKMIAITINATVVGDLIGITRTITSSETPKAPWTVFYEDGSDEFHFSLRADRNGNNAGRIYTITYTGTDQCGNIASVSTTVVVPHDQRPRSDIR